MKYILILLLFISCGTRKTELNRHEAINIENTYSEGTKIVLGNSFTYTPFNALKPMKIEGKVYENAIVSNDKSKILIKWKTQYITKTITIEKKKTTEKTDNTILFLGLFFIFCLFVFLWFKTGS